MDQYREAAYQVLEAAGMPRPNRLTRQRHGIANKVFKADDVAVRLGVGSDGRYFARSASVLRAIEGRVRSNHLLYLDDSESRFDCPVMVTSWLPGMVLSKSWPGLDVTERRRRWLLVLEELERLHGTPVQEISWFDGAPSWQTRRIAEFEAYRDDVRERHSAERSIIETVASFWGTHQPSLFEASRSVLCHLDINPTNVLFDGDSLAGIIDFDDADVCPSEMEFWQMAWVLTDGPDPYRLDEVKSLFRDFYGFSGAGALERAMLDESYWIMRQLSERVSWQSVRQSVADARETFENVFVAQGLRAWFE